MYIFLLDSYKFSLWKIYMNSKLISIAIGLLMGYIIIKILIPISTYHGPNSNIVRKQIHQDKKTSSCYRFIPQPYVCPTH